MTVLDLFCGEGDAYGDLLSLAMRMATYEFSRIFDDEERKCGTGSGM